MGKKVGVHEERMSIGSEGSKSTSDEFLELDIEQANSQSTERPSRKRKKSEMMKKMSTNNGDSKGLENGGK